MWRVGIGYDIHRLAEGRPLWLGGLEVPYSRGLLGHSDADVVLHAIIDALMGAAGLPDIGELFPDTDPAWKDADSRDLLTAVMERVREAGYEPVNLDCVIHAEEPKISPHKRPMADAIAGLVGVDPGRVSVKATSNEGLGPIGAGEAIACTAVALVVGNSE
jgi:2-C-methyl-D-erythritol 2,4-cyclodiphosphate synthase